MIQSLSTSEVVVLGFVELQSASAPAATIGQNYPGAGTAVEILTRGPSYDVVVQR